MSFKTGDKVICINKSDVGSLTLGKVYTMLDVDDEGLSVKNDFEKVGWFFSWRFKPVIKVNKKDLL